MTHTYTLANPKALVRIWLSVDTTQSKTTKQHEKQIFNLVGERKVGLGIQFLT